MEIIACGALGAEHSLKVLINTTHPDNPGGVAHFYRVVRPFLDPETDYHIIGRRPWEKAWLQRVFRVFRDYKSFIFCMSKGQYQLVLLNPSFAYLSLLRDSFFVLFAKLWQKKVVVFFRGWDPAVCDSVERNLRPLISLGIFRADAIIVLAREFEASIKNMGYVGPVFVASTVVADEMLEISSNRIFEPYRPVSVLFLGRIVRKKGIYEAIDAFARFCEYGGEGILTVAGDGPELPNVRAHVVRKGIKNIMFVGYIKSEKKREVLLRSDILISPTYYGEGMPNALLEAFASGLAVICRPVGGIKDFFEHGVMGFCTDSRDPTEFAKYLKILADDRSRMAQISTFNANYAKERFSARIVANKLESICRIAFKGSAD